MSIFCSLLQKTYGLDSYLPENSNYINYSIKAYEKIRDTEKLYPTNGVIISIYHFISYFYQETNRFEIPKQTVAFKKFKNLKGILENRLISGINKETFFTIFSTSQKNYFALSRFACICKIKKTQFKAKTDLLLNDIDLSKKNIFVFIQTGAKYVFVINDLINIINTSLSNSPYWFAEPIEIKNPYNNVPLSKTILYNLYFYMRANLYSVPILFDLFFHSHFELGLFTLNNENYIREIYIQKFTQTSNFKILHKYVIGMFYEYKAYINNIYINNSFPKKILVDKMRPYLQYYLLSKYLIFGSEKRYKVEETLRKKLFKFANCNPKFGRKTIIFKPCENNPKKMKKVYEYNTECEYFYDNDPKNFIVNWKKFENISQDDENRSIFDYDEEADDYMNEEYEDEDYN